MRKVKKDQGRIEVLEKIAKFEMTGQFNCDVENDPPYKTLDAKKVDLLHEKLTSKIKRRWGYFLAYRFLESMIGAKKLVMGKTQGLENLDKIDSGAIITCNHINLVDNLIVLLEFKKKFKKIKRPNQLYRVVREGNYSLNGFLGTIMRNCDTLPIDQDGKNMRLNAKVMGAIRTLLERKKLILIYPEQSLWWNYRKPRPLKSGAFMIASKNNAPVIPTFITMRETARTGKDGFPILEYTLNIGAPIYPDSNLNVKENAQAMMEKNQKIWQEIYEKTYGEDENE